MGLENGIYFKFDYDSKLINLMDRRFPCYAMSKLRPCEFEICYWRKHWYLRGKLLCIAPKSCDGYSELTIEQMQDIYDLLKRANKHNWEEDYTDYWSWSDIKPAHRANLRRLKRAIKIKKKYPTLKVIFYDSP